MIAHTWSEIFVVFSLSIGWLIWANALVAASAASVRSVESDFIVSLLRHAEVRPRGKALRIERNLLFFGLENSTIVP